MLAIVDEDSDITFYEAREKTMSGLMAEEGEGGMATGWKNRVVLCMLRVSCSTDAYMDFMETW